MVLLMKVYKVMKVLQKNSKRYCTVVLVGDSCLSKTGIKWAKTNIFKKCLNFC